MYQEANTNAPLINYASHGPLGKAPGKKERRKTNHKAARFVFVKDNLPRSLWRGFFLYAQVAHRAQPPYVIHSCFRLALWRLTR